MRSSGEGCIISMDCCVVRDGKKGSEKGHEHQEAI